MKVTIRSSTEISYSVTIPDNSTVEDLRNSAKVACPPSGKIPEDFKLIYNGEKLTPNYKTLEAFGIVAGAEDIVVILMSDGSDTPKSTSPIGSPALQPVASATGGGSVGPAKKKTKKNRCSFKNCSAVPLRMVGNCSHCQGKFCAKHRLLEDHLCQGLQFCKDNAHEKNAMKLQNEKTITSKV